MSSQGLSSKRNWPMFFSGLLVLLAGAVVLFAPGLSLVTIAIIAGVFFLIAGFGSFANYGIVRGTSGAGWIMLNGIFDILLGVMFVAYPVATAAILPWLAGVTVIIYSIYAIIAGIAVRAIGIVWGLLLFTGIIGLLCGIMFIVSPASFPTFLAILLIVRGSTMAINGIIGTPSAM